MVAAFAELESGEDESGVEEGVGFCGFGGVEEEGVDDDVGDFEAFGLFDGGALPNQEINL